MTFAHVAGMPVEESVQMLAPASVAMATWVLVWLRRR